MRQAFTDDIGGFCIGVCAARSVPRLQYFRIAIIPIAVIPCTPFCSVIIAAWVQELSRLQYLRIAVSSCEYLLVCDSWCMDPRFQYLRIAVRDSLHAFLFYDCCCMVPRALTRLQYSRIAVTPGEHFCSVITRAWIQGFSTSIAVIPCKLSCSVAAAA